MRRLGPSLTLAFERDRDSGCVDPARRRSLRKGLEHVIALVFVLGVLSVAGAHATVVLGTLTTTPDPPRAGVPTVITVHLEDPTLSPIQDAIVFADLKGPGGGDATELRLVEEAEPEGTYRAQWTPNSAGSFGVTIRDRTFRQEEAVAELSLGVGEGLDANGSVPFLLPPTPTAPRSMATWLVWLIGLPILAGVIVTVLVLRTSPKVEEPKSS